MTKGNAALHVVVLPLCSCDGGNRCATSFCAELRTWAVSVAKLLYRVTRLTSTLIYQLPVPNSYEQQHARSTMTISILPQRFNRRLRTSAVQAGVYMNSAWLDHRANLKPRRLNSNGGVGNEEATHLRENPRPVPAGTLLKRCLVVHLFSLSLRCHVPGSLFTSRIEQHEQEGTS